MKQILKLAIIAVGCLMAGLFLLALILFFIVYKNDSKQPVEDRYLTNRQYAKVINAPAKAAAIEPRNANDEPRKTGLLNFVKSK